MKVFISWSGVRSRHIAEALRSWLPRVIQAVRPWMSDVDVPAGARWQSDIADALDVSKFGIICVTPENMSKPWLMFEAGALSKSMKSSHVCPLVFDMELGALSGPVAQFQAKILDRDGVYGILDAINKAIPDAKLDDAHLAEQFEIMWPRLEAALASIPEVPAESLETETHAHSPQPDMSVLLDIISDYRKKETAFESAFTVQMREEVPQNAYSVPRSVVYAPISTMEGAIVYVEAQWNRRVARENIPESQLALIAEVWKTLDAWRDASFGIPVVAIDLSDTVTLGDEVVDRLMDLAEEHGGIIEVGFSQDQLAVEPRGMHNLMKKLSAAGLRIGLRAFGMGTFNLVSIETAPLNTLWIAAELVEDIILNANDRYVVEAIGKLAFKLSADVIAEGVSDSKQSAVLTKLGVRMIKGTMAGDVMTADEVYTRFA